PTAPAPPVVQSQGCAIKIEVYGGRGVEAEELPYERPLTIAMRSACTSTEPGPMPIAGGAPPKGSPAACAAGKNPWIRRDCSKCHFLPLSNWFPGWCDCPRGATMRRLCERRRARHAAADLAVRRRPGACRALVAETLARR